MPDALFEPDPTQVRTDEAAEQMSATRRRTLQQAEDIAAGSHPLSRPLGRHLPLHAEAVPKLTRVGDSRRCGNCRFRQLLTYHNSTYPKCTKDGMPVNHSTSTDVRRGWPGCVHHEYAEEAVDA